jgi:hypothetical protein
MARFEEHKDLSAAQIGQVLRVKLGEGYNLRDPQIDKIDADNKTEFVFKVMVEAPASAILQPGEHFMFFVSRLTGKDMDDWLEAAVHKIKAYAAHKSEALKF